MWRFLFLTPLYLLVTSLPLIFDVGTNLEYEYALASSYLSLVVIPLFGFFLSPKYLPTLQNKYAIQVPLEVFWIFIISPLIAVIPALYMFFVGGCPCSGNGYLFWMVMLVYPAWIFAHAAMHFTLRCRVMNVPRRRVLLALAAIYGILVIATVAELWFQPQKRLTTLLAGFLHGPIYDEYIAFDGGILLSRTAHFFLATMLLLIVWLKGQTLQIVSIILIFGAWMVSAGFAGKYPSSQNGQEYLSRQLYRKLTDQGLSLYYRPESKKKAVPKKIERLFKDAQFHAQELRQIFKLGAEPHVHIYVYPNRTAKKLWFGGGATDVTDVYTPSIHITDDYWPHPTLRHELVHALASDFGYWGLGFHPNMAFTEGLAVALAPQERILDLDAGAASLIESQKLPPIKKLFSFAFWQHSGARAYTTAGSFINYLIRSHGIGPVKNLYAGAGFEDAFGKNADQLIDAWRTEITKRFEKDKQGLLAESIYRHPGVLKSLCPHSKADLKRRRSVSAFTRMRQPVGWDPEEDYLPWRLSLNSDDIATRLRIWRKEIRKVARERFTPVGRVTTWAEALKKARKWPVKSIEDIEMALIESDLRRLLNQIEPSVEILVGLSDLITEKKVSHNLHRQIEARLMIEKTVGSEQALEWRKFLSHWRKSRPAVAADAPWLLHYLSLRNIKRKMSTVDLKRYRAMTPDPDLSQTFHMEWYKTLGHRFMRADAYRQAQEAYALAASAAPPARRSIMLEHSRRAEFYLKNSELTH